MVCYLWVMVRFGFRGRDSVKEYCGDDGQMHLYANICIHLGTYLHMHTCMHTHTCVQTCIHNIHKYVFIHISIVSVTHICQSLRS